MKKILLFFISIYFIGPIFSQTKTNIPINADSLATANYKDVLNSFFQLAVDRFTGPKKEIRFTSNPFAVMAKLDTSLLMDREYYKYRHMRDLNFSFSAKLDSSYRFNGFSAGVKYALINQRDETVSRLFVNDVLFDSKTQELFALNMALEQSISTFLNDPINGKIIRVQKTKFFNGDLNFNQLNKSFQQKIIQILKEKNLAILLNLIKEEPSFNIKKTKTQIYDAIKEKINNRLLWTVGVTDTSYNDKLMFSNIVFSSDLVKGIDNMKSKDIELNLRAALQLVDDSSKKGNDLKRSIFSFEPGLNFVFKNKNNLKSIFEFKLSGSYYHTFSNLYKSEKRDSVTVNSTLRIRVYNDIWIPIEIKYDPYSGNIFGFFNVRVNFTAMGKLLKKDT